MSDKDILRAAFNQYRTCVIIPTYNNDITLPAVIADVAEYTHNIIVVNDGSTDDTALILASLPHIDIVSYPKNKGKGWALRKGFEKAVESGYAHAITIDSDGQHFAKDLPVFMDKLELTKDAIIIGARNMDQSSVPGKSSFGYKFSNFWFKIETGINTPDTQSGYRLYPVALMKDIIFFTRKYEFEIEVLGKKEMEQLGMGAILAVNKGSVEEPRLIVLKYQATDTWEDVVGLVGKGITYDTGGYSLKPKDGMVGMKGDMGGAAAVLGAMTIVGETRPEKNVMAVIASTDNMISGEAFKPDDVITSLSGKTIEVLNTDAEGRLVLADAVTYAKQNGADYLIDVATLTGGVIVALGMDKTGALTNNESFFEQFMEATVESGEFVWRLPLTENDRKRLRKSDVADLNNSPGRDGHMIFGGGFVGEFAEDTPWIHLDIAGTSSANATHDLGPKGATGVMVRTLGTFIERLATE